AGVAHLRSVLARRGVPRARASFARRYDSLDRRRARDAGTARVRGARNCHKLTPMRHRLFHAIVLVGVALPGCGANVATGATDGAATDATTDATTDAALGDASSDSQTTDGDSDATAADSTSPDGSADATSSDSADGTLEADTCAAGSCFCVPCIK